MKLLTSYTCFEDPVGCYAAGPMLNGATQVLFEGVPTYPDAGRAWDIVDKYKVQSQSHTHLSCMPGHTYARQMGSVQRYTREHLDYHHPAARGLICVPISCAGCGCGLESRISHCQEAVGSS